MSNTGRWQIMACPVCLNDEEGWWDCKRADCCRFQELRNMPAVPCDEAAVERAARAIDDAAYGGLDAIRDEDPERLVAWARAALAAAGRVP